MKKLTTSPRFLHLFYGSVIALLGLYVYFTNVKIEEYKYIISTLNSQVEIEKKFTSKNARDFYRYTDAYRNPIGVKANQDFRDISFNCDKLVLELDSLVVHFEQNIEKKPEILQKTAILTRLYFKEGKIASLQNTIDAAVDSIFSKISDVKDKDLLFKEYKRHDFAKEDFNTLPTHLAIVKIKQQIIEIRQLEHLMVNHFFSKYTCGMVIYDEFRINLFPYSSTVRVDEPFKVDMALCDYSTKSREPYHTYYIDNEEIKPNRGIATFAKTYSTPGKKTIQAKALVKNPMTGEVKEQRREYSFEVLPKR